MQNLCHICATTQKMARHSRSRSRSAERRRRRSRSRSRNRSRSPRRHSDDRWRQRDSTYEQERFSSPRSRHRSRSQERSRGVRAEPRGWYAAEYNPIQAGSIDGTDTVPHDKALVRALNARFDPSRDPQIQGDPYATLFVGRLNFATTEETLHQIFGRYGRIKRVRLVRDRDTQQSKGYAFIEYDDERGFRIAYHSTHGTTIDDREILVDFERSRVLPGWKPRRLGGGLGGKRESGQLRFGGRDRPFKPPR